MDAYGVRTPGSAIPGGSRGEAPGLTAIELVGALERDELKVVWIAATDPVASLPNAERVRAALQHPPGG